MFLKKVHFLFVFLGFNFLVMVGCESMTNEPSWKDGMRGMSESINSLIPYIYNDDNFSDPNNKKFIEPKLNNLKYYSHHLDEHLAKWLSGKDPLFDIGLKGLKRSIQNGADSYQVESYEYSQKLLQSSVNYCVKCHSRSYLGPRFSSWDNFVKPDSMDPIDLAKIYIATRKFGQAAVTLEKHAVSVNLKESEKLKTLKMLMIVYLKNLDAPQNAIKANKTIMKYEKNRSLRTLLKKWNFDIQSWKKSGVTKKGRRFVKVSPRNRNKDLTFVQSLNQTVLLHAALSRDLKSKQRGETYYSLGKIYSVNSELGFQSLPELYFESCIRTHPHSHIARKCYYALESLVRKNLKLEVGNSLPRDEANKLKKLKKLTGKLSRSSTPSFRGEGF